MKIKVVKQGDQDDAELSLLVVYAETPTDRKCLSEILTMLSVTLKAYLAKENSDDRGNHESPATQSGRNVP